MEEIQAEQVTDDVEAINDILCEIADMRYTRRVNINRSRLSSYKTSNTPNRVVRWATEPLGICKGF